mgnify:CR=1 FL=1
MTSKKTNETIGQSAEAAICQVYDIECVISPTRLDKDMIQKIIHLLDKDIFPAPVSESIGYKNGTADFRLADGTTLSLKTLKHASGKVCPQLGQPTLKSWDRRWDQVWQGELSHNPDRWQFIKENIHNYLHCMLDGIFSCDHLMLITNCISEPQISVFNSESLQHIKNYFTNQDIIYSRPDYEERWNEKKKKYSEASCTIYLSETMKIGEFQFHKSSRQVLKFRFFDSFLSYICSNNLS